MGKENQKGSKTPPKPHSKAPDGLQGRNNKRLDKILEDKFRANRSLSRKLSNIRIAREDSPDTSQLRNTLPISMPSTQHLNQANLARAVPYSSSHSHSSSQDRNKSDLEQSTLHSHIQRTFAPIDKLKGKAPRKKESNYLNMGKLSENFLSFSKPSLGNNQTTSMRDAEEDYPSENSSKQSKTKTKGSTRSKQSKEGKEGKTKDSSQPERKKPKEKKAKKSIREIEGSFTRHNLTDFIAKQQNKLLRGIDKQT